MDSSRLAFSPKTQHIESLEDASTTISTSLQTHHEGLVETPIDHSSQAALRTRNAFIPTTHFPRFASTYRQLPQTPFGHTISPYPSFLLEYPHSRRVPPFTPPVHAIDLNGFWCEPGDREYEEAAKAKGVTDKSPIYWFRETSFGYGSATRRDPEVHEMGINDEWNYLHAGSRAKEESAAEKRGLEAVIRGDESIDGNGNARIGRHARGNRQ